MLPPSPVPRGVANGVDIRGLDPVPRPIPTEIGERLNAVRLELITAVGRERKASELPPPMRVGMKPSDIPPYGMIIALPSLVAELA